MSSYKHLRSTLLLLVSLLCGSAAFAEPVYIDVRTVDEYSADHIEGDLNLPLAELDTAALAERFGKDAELVLYCRSGNRAGQAMEQLLAAGFTNVSNGGGISDIRELRAQGSAVAAGGTTTTGAISAPNQ